MNMQDVKAKFKNTNSWLIAPNGNPTNLTEQQWLLTRTTAFKNWFGDWEDSNHHSQVLDENGEPLVVYHGTNEAFSVFDTSNSGIHFGTNVQAAMRNRKHLMPCFLNIRTIKNCKDHGNQSHWKKQITAATRKGFTGIIYLNRYEGISYEEFNAARLNHGLTHDDLDSISDKKFQKYVSKSAFSYIVFEPNQIKSALNNTEFSCKSDDIYA